MTTTAAAETIDHAPVEVLALVAADDLGAKSKTWPDVARALAVVDAETFAEAGTLLVAMKTLRAQIDETFAPMQKRAYAAHQEVCAQRRKVEAPLTEAEGLLKASMARWRDEEERRQREEQRRLEAEARAREEARRLDEATALESAGFHEEAERVLDEEPVLPETPPAQRVAPKVAGVAMREKWTGVVVSKSELVAAAAAGDKQAMALLVVDQAALNRLAAALRDSLCIPGVGVRREHVVAARAGGGSR
jgi:hypothetical protein